MSLDQLTNLFATASLIDFFFKAFAIVFAVMYLFYGIIITRQSQLLNRALIGSNAAIFTLISFIQILIGAVLIYLAIIAL